MIEAKSEESGKAPSNPFGDPAKIWDGVSRSERLTIYLMEINFHGVWIKRKL